jgi:subtilisin family serine protease
VTIVDLASAELREGTGAGVRIAIVDSGVVAGHPHIPTVAGGISDEGDVVAVDYHDQLGHGTAVAAAIHEKAPRAELLIVRVFHTRLAASARALAHAIVWSADQRAHLINLSLGTSNPEHEALLAAAVAQAARAGARVVAALGVADAPLAAAVAQAARAGARVVAALGVADAPLLPGSLPGVIAVVADAALTRHTIVLTRDGGAVRVAASPLPRPIPGVPPERNLSGASFAVANATGVLARVLEASMASRPDRGPPVDWLKGCEE